MERIWRAEGLRVPPWQPKRGRLWLNDGSCVRLLNVVDEFSRTRQDNGPEFAATAVRGWISGVGARAMFLEPGSP